MRRPAVRFLLTLVAAASILGVVPATSDAGIIPWAWDTMFGPVGSIQARHATYHSGGFGGGYDNCNSCNGYSAGAFYGPAQPVFVGFRGWRRNRACCGNNGYAANYGGGYANYGGYGDYGCSSCGNACGGSCGASCGYDCGQGCGSGGCGVGGCGVGGCGPGGCANGQCNVNYGAAPNPGTGSANNGPAPVTPAAPPPGSAQSGPSPYDANVGPMGSAGPMGPMGPMGPNSVVPPVAPGTVGNDGFVPRNNNNSRGPAPTTGDPTQEEQFIPPVTPDSNGSGNGADNSGVDNNGNATTIPPVAPNPASPAKKRPTLGEEDDKETNVGPRLELEEKVTWRNSFVRVRQAQAPVRVTASAKRTGMFPKIAWRSSVDTELAKK